MNQHILLWRVISRLTLLFALASVGLVLLVQLTRPASAADPTIPDAPGSISGVVTDAAGAPLVDMDVTLYTASVYPDYWYAERVVRTDSTGAYRIGLLPAGIYRVGFRDPAQQLADSYYNSAPTVMQGTDVPIAGTNSTGINGILTAGSMITGVVTFPGAARPVDMSNLGSLRALRKVKGQWVEVKSVVVGNSFPAAAFTLGGLPAGVYRFCFYTHLFYSYEHSWIECYDNVATGVDQATDIPLAAGELRPNVNLVLGDGADLAQLGGSITAATGAPLGNIAVTAFISVTSAYGDYWRQATFTQTTLAGVYHFRDLQPGAYTLLFADSQDDYVDEFYDNVPTLGEFSRPTEATSIRLAPYELRTNVHATLTLASHIVGDVTVVGEGPPARADVQLFQQQATTWQFIRNWSTDGRGRFNIGGLLTGVYKVSANTQIGESLYGGYYGGANLDEATVITLTSATTHTNTHIDLTNFSATTPYASGFSGRVMANGQSVPNIKVTAYLFYSYPYYLPRVYVFTDTDGRYRIDGLLPNRYYVSFSDPRGAYATTWYNSFGQQSPWQWEGISIFESTVVTNINAALVPGGAISGSVRLRDQTPLNNIVVMLFAKLGESWWEIYPRIRTDENGAYTLPGLLPGVYRLCFYDEATRYRTECYGAPPQMNDVYGAVDLVVKAGETLTSIDQVLGPKLFVYLPFAARR